jgi:hypothetical protein
MHMFFSHMSRSSLAAKAMVLTVARLISSDIGIEANVLARKQHRYLVLYFQ